jgi:two-component system sensor histidine kinase UhpB
VALQAERAAAGASREREALEQIVATVHGSLADVRRIARELRPEALDDLGLVDALIALCLRIEQQGPLRITRRFAAELPEMTDEVELVLYRVTQEALTNVLRHSRAANVEVTLDHGAEGVLLSILDDGAGLAEDPGEDDGGGLAGMRERAMLIAADLRIESPPGAGLKVALTVPVAVAR